MLFPSRLTNRVVFVFDRITWRWVLFHGVYSFIMMNENGTSIAILNATHLNNLNFRVRLSHLEIL